jgi:TPP-dependent pyruvate/acetoin dehydrogenase alpha subunit
LDRWKERDPLLVTGTQLAQAGLLSAQEQAALAAETQEAVDAAAVAAAEAPFLSLEEAGSYVYAD